MNRRYTTKILLILTSCALLLTLQIRLMLTTLASTATPAWTSPGLAALQKLNDLAPNVAPAIRDTDCTNYTYTPKPPNSSAPRTICAFDTALGKIGNSNELFTGPQSTIPINGIEGVSNNVLFLSPTPDQRQAIAVPSATSLGNYVGFYTSLDRSQLRLSGSTSSGYYTLKSKPDAWLKDDTGATALINNSVMAYSANGDWLVADFPTIGLARVNMSTFQILPFAPSLEKPCSIAASFAKLAISNDGRYVAVSLLGQCQSPAQPSLELYDTSTCVGTVQNGAGINATCQHKDIWNGRIAGNPVDAGLTSLITTAQRPANLSFINSQNLSFDVAYEYRSDANFKVGSFLATVGGGAPHQVGLLGIGDSYISGQGTFQYRAGSDTATNGCHLSELSYPFLFTDYFSTFNSTACSGAKTDDVLRSDGAYKGQSRDGVAQKDRNIPDILSRYLPGYINQKRFVETYQPEALLVSIGGNDVGFGGIVSRCATPSRSESTCFSTWEDRADLINTINARYNRFVSTFKALKLAAPASRIYIVGYPQIAKPGGQCGANVLLNEQEVQFSADTITYLDSVLQQAAAAAGVVFVDTQHAFDGQRLCEGHGSGIAMNGFTTGKDNGITLLGHTVKFVGSEGYHPTQAGNRLLAQAISKATSGLTTPMPTPQTTLQPPGLSPGLALLQGVPKSGRPLKLVTYTDQLTSPRVTAGSTHPLQVIGTAAMLQPGGQYTVTLQSGTSFTTTADPAGNVTFTITFPSTLVPGYELVHVYGKNVAGDDIDVQQAVYVAALDDDPNKSDDCVIVSSSGQDVDSDGIDDACDAVIDAPPIRSYPPRVRLLTNTIEARRP